MSFLSSSSLFRPRSLVIGILILLVAVVGMLVYKNIVGRKNQPPSFTFNAVVQSPGVIESIVIEPSELDAGWLLYKEGARVVLEGAGLVAVKILFYPTGTGIGEARPNGEALGEATLEQESDDRQRWVLLMPKDILATALWAEGEVRQEVPEEGLEVRKIKSPELRQIRYDSSTQ